MISLPVNFDDLTKATKILKGIANHTPVLTSRCLDELLKAKVFFKCENFQRTGSFKFRGAYNSISCLNKDQKSRGVITFSSGNHAQAIALAGQILDVSTTILMPTDAPAIKLAATQSYGASIVQYDRNREDRETVARKLQNEQGLTLIPPYDYCDVIAGQGTTAKELIEEVGSLDYLFVCVGGGGLISGCSIAAAHLSPHCAVIGVEPEAGNDAQMSFHKKEIVTIAPPQTLADGARTQHIGKLVLPILLSHVKDMVTVSDKQLCNQMRFFAERMKIIVEPTGCLAAAAVFNKVVNISKARVGVIVSGGNVDIDFFSHCMQQSKL